MGKGSIILLNGVSSSGKSTLAKALIKRLPDYFHYSIDDFDLVIERMEDRDHGRLIPVPTEYFYHRTIAMFADKGVNLIADHVIHDPFTRTDWLESLAGYDVLRVGVHCPPEELERRERERGDRRIGQALEQLDFVHKDEVYDLEVDTCVNSLEECVNKILGRVS
ncbi:chloramphenicol phosphotransferase [Paenibacillus sp. PK3_47]|uniref:phosphotransferase-like protein n=1 Tax=Paenibacillus sp. PK3_47 TaxID=2072642 RepID=UPI00201E3792|nr:AAA family ATPase [Paenibacillus sp. PK3_47]UQZ35392.1 chloramphenicol phosphotransferase [Paenibacillus sp. PK3_47]